MQDQKSQNKANKHKPIPKSVILDCYGSKHIKVVDLTEVLAKFPEIFSITASEPECRKEFTLNPNDGILAQPVYNQNRKAIPTSHNPEYSAKPKIVIPPSPFSTFRKGEDAAARGWYYIDERDATQGPFSSIEMDNWFEQGFFFNELLVRFGEGEFSKLIDLLGKTTAPSGGFNRGQGERHYNKESHRDHHNKKEHQKDTPFVIGRSNLVSRDAKDTSGPKPVLPQVFNQIHSPSSGELQQIGQHKQKPDSKRGSKRVTTEETTEMMQKNIWENFVDKNKPTEQKVAAEGKPENKGEAQTQHKTAKDSDAKQTKATEVIETKKEENQKELEHDTEKSSKNKRNKKKKKHDHSPKEEETKEKHEELKLKQQEQKESAPKEAQATDKGAHKSTQKEITATQKIAEETKTAKEEPQTKKEAPEQKQELVEIKNKFEDIDSGDWIESGPKNAGRKKHKKKGKNQHQSEIAESVVVNTQEDRQKPTQEQSTTTQKKNTVAEPKASNQQEKKPEKKTTEEPPKAKILTWEESFSKKEEAPKFQAVEAEEEYPSLSESIKLTSKDIKKAAVSKKAAQQSVSQKEEVEKGSPVEKSSKQIDTLFPPLGSDAPQKKKDAMPAVANKKMVPVQLEKKGSDKKPATWDDLKKTAAKAESKAEKSSKNNYDMDFPSL